MNNNIVRMTEAQKQAIDDLSNRLMRKELTDDEYVAECIKLHPEIVPGQPHTIEVIPS